MGRLGYRAIVFLRRLFQNLVPAQVYAGGSSYVGEFKDGHKHGHGKFFYTSGNTHILIPKYAYIYTYIHTYMHRNQCYSVSFVESSYIRNT